MQRSIQDRLAVICISIVVVAVFARLFLPVPQLLVTPDFGRSDAWHFSFPTKYALSQALKSGSLPLWQDDVGDGFPLLAEGQTGAYFLPNMLLFSFLPPVAAYNTALALSIAMLALGMYALLRLLDISPLGSLFGALTFAFSGLPILQLPHITLLQGISMMPLIIALTVRLNRDGAFPWLTWLSIAISQQFFAGFPQATLLTLIVAGLYTIWQTAVSGRIARGIAFGIAVLLGFTGGAAQIVPSFEFLRSGTNPHGFGFIQATQYSLPLTHLITFLSPFALGNPKLGTYPPFWQFDGSIFWENTAYLGLLPVVCMVIAWIAAKRRDLIYVASLLLAGSLVLAWGKYSPLYILFTVWPLNLFRVPSRFLWLTVVAVTLLAASGFDAVYMRYRSFRIRILLVFVIMVALAQLGAAWWSYHLIVPAAELLHPVQQADIHDPVYTVASSGAHNAVYISKGWQDPRPFISLYTQSLEPESNILYQHSQHSVYAGRFLYRSSLADSFLSQLLPMDEKEATVSSPVMLNLLGIQTVLSYIPLHAPTLSQTSVSTESGITRYVYTNTNAVPRAYLVREATTAGSLNEAVPRMLAPSFTPGETALIEPEEIRIHPELRQFISSGMHVPQNNDVRIINERHTAVELTVTSPGASSLLILTDTYYPGWNATVDGRQTPIIPVNIKQRGVIVPEGTHRVVFTYNPQSVLWGQIISIISVIVAGVLAVYRPASQTGGTERTTHRRAGDFRHNRAR